MPGPLLAIYTVTFGLALWLGAFLLARNPTAPHLRYAGLGLIAYALALAGETLLGFSSFPSSWIWNSFSRPLFFVSALLWSGSLIYLIPEDGESLPSLAQLWARLFLPISLLTYGVLAGVGWFESASVPIQRGTAILTLLPLLLLAIWIGRTALVGGSNRQVGLLLVALIFFGLSTGPVLIPVSYLPRSWLVVIMGLDLLFLGVVAARMDAFSEGEALWPDMVRSLDATFLVATLFGGTVGLTMMLDRGVTPAMTALLLSVVGLAILTQAFQALLQEWMDRLAFASYPRVRENRAALRVESEIEPRVDDELDPMQMGEEEFVRLTRRALSHYGNLPKLAANPLARLPLVSQRLREAGTEESTLTRASALKQVLTESIDRLRPPGEDGFSATDAWRHYNALYYPYVVGLKPYSRRATDDSLDKESRAALEWFRLYVPQRTLYNWQTGASALIAQNLREQG